MGVGTYWRDLRLHVEWYGPVQVPNPYTRLPELMSTRIRKFAA